MQSSGSRNLAVEAWMNFGFFWHRDHDLRDACLDFMLHRALFSSPCLHKGECRTGRLCKDRFSNHRGKVLKKNVYVCAVKEGNERKCVPCLSCTELQ